MTEERAPMDDERADERALALGLALFKIAPRPNIVLSKPNRSPNAPNNGPKSPISTERARVLAAH